ncbi:hypothetical protein B0H11DRAFT_17504 [Mycena galericulata]|nr:hypothetical protein B0H11DRAFT_17504 [Mycena galericulata]
MRREAFRVFLSAASVPARTSFSYVLLVLRFYDDDDDEYEDEAPTSATPPAPRSTPTLFPRPPVSPSLPHYLPPSSAISHLIYLSIYLSIYLPRQHQRTPAPTYHPAWQPSVYPSIHPLPFPNLECYFRDGTGRDFDLSQRSLRCYARALRTAVGIGIDLRVG